MARPRLRRGDRFFWVALSGLWRGWKQALVIVAPDTVLCWQRRRFRDYWTRRSRRSVVGRPPVAPELRALVPKWPPPIPYGVPPESMASSSSWASTFGRAHRLPADPQAAPLAVADLPHVPGSLSRHTW